MEGCKQAGNAILSSVIISLRARFFARLSEALSTFIIMLNKPHFLVRISNKHLFVLPNTLALFPVTILVSKEPFVGVDCTSVFPTATLRESKQIKRQL